MQFKNKFPTPSEYTKGTNTCEYIVLHHTGTPEGTINGVLNGLTKRYDYASCHYVIDVNGDVYKIGNDTDILWHAGTSSWDGKINLNNYSIGIEIIGPLSDGGFTDNQRESLNELVKYLSDIHKISKERVIRHKDISPGRKVDPDDSLWNKLYKTYKDYIDSIFENQGKYRKIAGKSVINDPKNLVKAIRSGSADEAVAAIEIIVNRKI